jgi:hypothetical protein
MNWGGVSHQASRQRRYRVWASIAALLMIGGCASGAGSSASSPTTSGSCVTAYSPAALRKRSFAFDGEITQVRAAQDRHLPADTKT